IRDVAVEIGGHQASVADDIAWWQATLTIDRILKHDGRCRVAAVAASNASRAVLAIAEHDHQTAADTAVITVARAAGTIARGLVAGCGSSKSSASSGPVTLRLGYFPNVTHATALVGVANGLFAKDLGSKVTLKTSTFNAGPAAVEALFAGAIDATYIGPSP